VILSRPRRGAVGCAQEQDDGLAGRDDSARHLDIGGGEPERGGYLEVAVSVDGTYMTVPRK
jgi:hypothetical protein